MSEFGLTAEFKNSAKEGGITPSSRQPVHMPEFIDFVDAATMPADAMPSPVPGMDMREYKMNIAMALSDPESPNIRPAFMQWVKQQFSAQGKEDKKERQLYDFILHLAIQDNIREINDRIRQYNEMADWYREHAQITAENMEKLAKIMQESGEFIDAVDEIYEEQRKTGHFNRNKALAALAKRGIDVDKNIGDAQLIDLLFQQKQKDKEIYLTASELYDKEQKQKEDFETKAKDSETKAAELREGLKEAENSRDPEQAKQTTDDLLEGANSSTTHAAANLAEDAEERRRLDEENRKLRAQNADTKVNKFSTADDLFEEDESELKSQFTTATSSRNAELKEIPEEKPDAPRTPVPGISQP